MHLHILCLSDAKCSVGGLALHRRVPPAIEVEHVVGGCQIESYAASFQRENEEWWPTALLLKTLNHEIALLLRRTAIQKERLASQRLLQIGAQQRSHLGKLGENQGFIACRQSLFQHLLQPSQLA